MNRSAPGLLEIARTHTDHNMHRTTVKNGFPVIVFYLIHPGDSSVGVDRHIEDMFLVTQEGQLCTGWLELSDKEMERLEDEIFAGAVVKTRYKQRCLQRAG